MKLYVHLRRAVDGKHKFEVTISPESENPKKIKFGAKGYDDYTIHKDEERKKRYIERHHANESWFDPMTKGFWSRWLLWQEPTIEESKKFIERYFDITFI